MSSCQKAAQNTDKGLCRNCISCLQKKGIGLFKLRYSFSRGFNDKVPTNTGSQWIWNTNAYQDIASTLPCPHRAAFPQLFHALTIRAFGCESTGYAQSSDGISGSFTALVVPAELLEEQNLLQNCLFLWCPAALQQ